MKPVDEDFVVSDALEVQGDEERKRQPRPVDERGSTHAARRPQQGDERPRSLGRVLGHRTEVASVGKPVTEDPRLMAELVAKYLGEAMPDPELYAFAVARGVVPPADIKTRDQRSLFSVRFRARTWASWNGTGGPTRMSVRTPRRGSRRSVLGDRLAARPLRLGLCRGAVHELPLAAFSWMAWMSA